mgnify:CR=1 FL=1
MFLAEPVLLDVPVVFDVVLFDEVPFVESLVTFITYVLSFSWSSSLTSISILFFPSFKDTLVSQSSSSLTLVPLTLTLSSLSSGSAAILRKFTLFSTSILYSVVFCLNPSFTVS